MKRIIATLLCFIALAAHAESWVPITKSLNGQSSFEIKAGTGEFITYGNEKRPALRVVARVTTVGDSKPVFVLYVVETRDCAAEFGTLHSYNLSREWLYSTDWAGTSTVAGIIANAICEAMRSAGQQQSKGSNT